MQRERPNSSSFDGIVTVELEEDLRTEHETSKSDQNQFELEVISTLELLSSPLKVQLSLAPHISLPC